MLDIPKPSMDEFYSYLAKWEETKKYSEWDNVFEKLFIQTFPKNNNFSEVWIKCSVLNDLYSLNIFNTFAIVTHILKIKDFDLRLLKKDYSLVDEIANTKIGRLYSFATKYCAKHIGSDYPIYDKYIDKVLMYFNKKYKFCEFRKSDLKNYENFVSILKSFKTYFGLVCKFDELDHYLWQLGKKYF